MEMFHIQTPEVVARRWKEYGMPPKMDGLSYMDVGCHDGGFVRHAKVLGARRTLGVDYVASEHVKDIPFVQCDVFSEKFLELPRFDVVSCIGVVYHTENPVSLITRLKNRVNRLLLLESEYRPHEPLNSAMWKLLPGNELGGNFSNWWLPNIKGVWAILEACGFTDIREVYANDHRVAFQASPNHSSVNPKIHPRKIM